MKRREFVAGLAGVLAAFPCAAQAQPTSTPVLGLLSGNAFDARELAAVRRGLNEGGYVEGRNLVIESRSAEGRYERLSSLAAELVERRVNLIVAIGGTATAVAAKSATNTVPIVFSNGGDPIKTGLVASLNRPGGNVTGVSFFVTTLGAKRIELLHEMAPGAVIVGYLGNPGNPNAEAETRDLQDAAQKLRVRIQVRNAASESEIDDAISLFKQNAVNAVVVGSDAFFLSRRAQLAALSLRHTLPMMCDVREHAAAGSLMSYGTDRNDAYRQAGVYAGKVLKGEKPADLPVMQSTKFEFAINLTTAKRLGLAVPPTLLARADEVIE
jgi:putative tryptophan/tyrosine transport system substrate-binding protein